jgi:hypothetical protein
VGGGKPTVEMLAPDQLTATQSSYRPTSGR